VPPGALERVLAPAPLTHFFDRPMPRPPAAPTARAPPRAQTACNSANPPPASGAVHAPGAGRAAPPMQLAHRRLPRPAPPVGRPTRRSSTGGGRRPGAGGHRTPAPGVACGLLTPETSPRAPGRPRERHGAGRRSARHRPGSLVRRPARGVDPLIARSPYNWQLLTRCSRLSRRILRSFLGARPPALPHAAAMAGIVEFVQSFFAPPQGRPPPGAGSSPGAPRAR
jgi:hypothetical protein